MHRLLWFPMRCSHLREQKAHSHIILILVISHLGKEELVCVTRKLCLGKVFFMYFKVLQVV